MIESDPSGAADMHERIFEVDRQRVEDGISFLWSAALALAAASLVVTALSSSPASGTSDSNKFRYAAQAFGCFVVALVGLSYAKVQAAVSKTNSSILSVMVRYRIDRQFRPGIKTGDIDDFGRIASGQCVTAGEVVHCIVIPFVLIGLGSLLFGLLCETSFRHSVSPNMGWSATLTLVALAQAVIVICILVALVNCVITAVRKVVHAAAFVTSGGLCLYRAIRRKKDTGRR